MGLLAKLGDKAVEGVFDAKTIRVKYDELAKIVTDKFIAGADDSFLKTVAKTAKGGIVISKEMKSKNERYDLHVGVRPNGLIWLNSKPAWVFDNEEQTFYQLDHNIKWKKIL